MVDQGGMKLTFIGVGSAFTRKNYNSGAVLEVPALAPEYGDIALPVALPPQRLLIDCGRTAPEAPLHATG